MGVTTSPRKECYLGRTLESLAHAGFPPPTVYAEPGSEVPDGYDTAFRSQHMGAFANWRQSLKDLSNTESEYVLLVQDDAIFCRNVLPFLAQQKWWDGDGVVSLYCSSARATGEGTVTISSSNIWGALALLFPTDVARSVVGHPMGASWRSTKKIDVFMGKCMQSLRKRVRAYSPSLAQHIGAVSAIPHHSGAHGRRAASDFLGEEFNALDLLSDNDG